MRSSLKILWRLLPVRRVLLRNTRDGWPAVIARSWTRVD
jgi:hypothetical protein